MLLVKSYVRLSVCLYTVVQCVSKLEVEGWLLSCDRHVTCDAYLQIQISTSALMQRKKTLLDLWVSSKSTCKGEGGVSKHISNTKTATCLQGQDKHITLKQCSTASNPVLSFTHNISPPRG